ncbi:MAG: cation diffusion facilitator family transporter [Rhizobiales bacterium]|nr:cation diffusion facilitator family transporter [Hyphomicrobiales bacterium]
MSHSPAPDNLKHEKTTVAAWSLFASFLLATTKFAAALVSGSLGLLSEAFHSTLDFVATAVTFFAIRYAERPADENHPFGHAKMESIAALIETGMLFGITGWIVYEAVVRLLEGGHNVEISWWIVAVVVGSIIIDFNRSRALQRTADKTQSDALAADALHFRADLWSSCAVLAGLGLSYAGYAWADPAAALVVAGFVAHAAYGLGQRTLATLLDAAPAGLAMNLSSIAQAVDGVLSVSAVRARPAGPTLFVELTIDVARTLHVQRIVEIKQEVTREILRQHPSADVNVSTNPVEIDDETAHDKIMHIATSHDAAIHHVTIQVTDERLAVSFDLEVDGDTPLSEAHAQATNLEEAIRDGLGGNVEVESHIEPRPPALLHGQEPTPRVRAQIIAELEKLAKREKQLSDLHNIRIRATEEGLFVHYHCRFAPETPVQAVHDVVDRIEVRLMDAVKNVGRVVAHAEPVGQARHKL